MKHSRIAWVVVFCAGLVGGGAAIAFLGGEKERALTKANAEQKAETPAPSLPPEVKVGAVLDLFGNGAKIVGTHKVVEIRGNWVRFEVDQGGEKLDQWVNFNMIVFFRKVG